MREENLERYAPPRFTVNRLVNHLFSTKYSVESVYRLAVVQGAITRFPDVSWYQLDINFEIMASKCEAVIIRAGQGNWEDTKFRRNYAEAKRVGLLRGIYWFSDDRYSPREQFTAIEEILESVGLPEMEVWIDWENTYGGQHGGLKNVVALMELIEARFPAVTVGLYTGYYWFVDHSNVVLNYSQYKYLARHPLWLGWYTDNILNVRVPAPWTFMRLWQYGTPAMGLELGAQSIEIDMNAFTDPEYGFDELYRDGLPDEEPPTGEGETDMDILELRSTDITKYRTIRQGPDIKSDPVVATPKMPAGENSVAKSYDQPEYTRVYTSDVPDASIAGGYKARAGDTWRKVFLVNGGPASGWMAEIHLGVRYLNVTRVPGTDPTPDPEPTPAEEIVITQTFAAQGYDVQPVVQAGSTITVTLKPK